MDGGGWNSLDDERGRTRGAAKELEHLLSRRARLAGQVHAAVAVALESGAHASVLEQTLLHIAEGVADHARVNSLIQDRLNTLKGDMVSDDD